MRKQNTNAFTVLYYAWIILFVILPVLLLLFESFKNINGQFTLGNYRSFFESGTYLRMTFNSVFFAIVVTLITLLISYPMAFIMSRLKHAQFWLLLVILPTWVNLLLKAYAFIGLFAKQGTVNDFLTFIGIGPQQLMFTNTAFITVAAYIEIPFMIMPIFNSLVEIDQSLINAARDLGATQAQTMRKVVIPLSMNGVRAGIQAVFIPTLSLFMITRLIGGNRVITLGTAIEEHFLVTQNWGMGATIGIVLIVAMVITMYLTRDRKQGGK
ncbi:spermidine/putrescine transport system permease protein [Weissella uvarum]|uniref:ABC transporter permease n=1 Tax=Weissella uvarum TaxID=1479233 RepID=UPI00195F98B1|nr:ABC transporter permease [Weissella uvarum]MBM7617988.1 spermidine/putrescine transport system permease protein [Weissella uvarum]MCM0596207.1 ABC transporter permease [Weissella uvarum]